MRWTRLVDLVKHIVFETLNTEIMPTLQVRYLINWFLIIAYFTFESLLVAFKELSIDLLHPPFWVIFFSIYFIQLLLFMLVERVLPFDNLVKMISTSSFKTLQVLLMSAVRLVTCEAFIVLWGNIFWSRVNFKPVSESFRRNMFVHFHPLLA